MLEVEMDSVENNVRRLNSNMTQMERSLEKLIEQDSTLNNTDESDCCDEEQEGGGHISTMAGKQLSSHGGTQGDTFDDQEVVLGSAGVSIKKQGSMMDFL